MSKDLKDLINSVEKESKSQAELEQIIHSLKEELNRLEFTVNEQKLLIENLKSQMKDDELEQAKLPSEIDILKDIITAQRKELGEKDNLIDNLNDKIIGFDTKTENSEESTSREFLNEEFGNAQKLIVQLTEENEQLRYQINQFEQKIEDLQSHEGYMDDLLDDETKIRENEELINFKKLNFHLMQENGLLRVEIESLKAKLEEKTDDTSYEELYNAYEKIDALTLDLGEHKSQIEILNDKLQEQIDEASSEELINAYEKIDALTLELEEYKSQIEILNDKLQEEPDEASSEELINTYIKIDELTLELEGYKTQVRSLQEQIGNLSGPVTVSTEEALEFAKLREEFDNLKSNLLEYQQENEKLNEKVLELEKEEKDLETVKIYSTSVPKGMPKKIKHTLFNRMYRLLDDENKNKVIDCLIQDLKSKNSETKSNAIKILSQIKNDKIYDAFLEIIDDQDWIVRYNLIKALNKFERKTDEFKVLLKKLTKDTDVDVRELAGKILKNFSE
jgi:chromosome segregation ATPase